MLTERLFCLSSVSTAVCQYIGAAEGVPSTVAPFTNMVNFNPSMDK